MLTPNIFVRGKFEFVQFAPITNISATSRAVAFGSGLKFSRLHACGAQLRRRNSRRYGLRLKECALSNCNGLARPARGITQLWPDTPSCSQT
jgi:hypothetical protein